MKQKAKKIISFVLCLIMIISVVPANVFAADYDEQDGDYYSVVSQKDWELAPGIVESEIVLNNDAKDRRQVMHVVEVDVNNEYTKVIPSSKGMTPTPGEYGVQTMDKQAAYAEANGYGNVVAAMNISLSWYDSAYYDEHPELVGEPLGYLILDGVQYTNSKGQSSGAQTCLVINFDEKDGEARPSDIPKTQIRSTSDPITGWEEQVIPANFGFLVKDGQMVNTKEEHTSEGASRSMLGIKEDGTIIMVMNDGRQAPYSTGFNNYEMSEAMLKLGCVYAINGDGGGSSQFLSQRPGEELEVNCSPSDGSLRATTHGVLVITTAPSDGEFVRAHVEAEHEYYTPGSDVQFKATGTDLAGGAADIPESATWQLTDSKMGTIDGTGLFTSNGTTGEVTAQLMYEGEVKGSATINIVVPDAISFGTAEAYTVPFEEDVTFNVTGTYGVFDVAMKADDYVITVENDELGTLDGNKYTSGNTAGVTSVTVALKTNASISKTVPLTIGKGSEVIFSFEEGTEGADLANWEIKDHEGKYEPYSDLEIVSAENGMVHNGETALAVHMPMHTRVHGQEGYAANSITWVGDKILLENATAIGMWVYVPEEATQTEIALNYVWYNNNGVQQRTTPDLCLNDYFNGNEYSGWHYLSVPISKSEAYIEDAKAVAASQGYKRNFFLKFYVTNSGNEGDESSYMGDITYYIDDVTIDYSDAVADRIAPVFADTYAKDPSVDSETTLVSGNTVEMNNGNLSFYAQVSDNNSLDAATASVTVDGKSVSASLKNGRITSEDVKLNAGVHRIVYEVADTMGNVSKAVRYIKVAGTNTPISVVPQNPDAKVAYTGSVYWVDVVAENAEKVDKVTMKLDLDTMHEWELNNIELANGYDVETYYASIADEKDNMITVVLTNNGSDVSGKSVLASIPARVWSYCGNDEGTELTPAEAWTTGAIPAVSVNVEVEQGEVIYKDNSSDLFSAEKMHLDTEAYIHQYKMDKTYLANNTYHVHTEKALTDKAATCTEAGYEGRTFCEGCDSVVDWGTKKEATGHSFNVTVDGLYTCEACEALFYYVDGKAQTGWKEIEGDVYYFAANGKAVDGEATVEGHTYTFTAHVLTEAAWEHDGAGLTCWWAGEQVKGGTDYESKWKTINGKKYYFTDIYAATGLVQVKISTDLGYKYHIFDENGVWLEDYTGLYNGTYGGKEGTYYVENGICVYKGLVQVDGYYYYINSTFKAVKSQTYYVSRTNDLLPAGEYTFDAEGKMIDPPSTEEPVIKEGIHEEDGKLYYYENGEKVAKGLVYDEKTGNYYCFGIRYYAIGEGEYWFNEAKLNGLTGPDGKTLKPGFYKVNADCTVYFAEPKEGICEEDGKLYYYENGEKVAKGLVYDEKTGNYYCFGIRYYAIGEGEYWFNEAKLNGLTGPDGKTLKPGFYKVNADCTVYFAEPKEGICEEDGKLYYYENGEKVAKGLVYDEKTGNYYCFGIRYYAIGEGEYWFNEAKLNGLAGPDGKTLKPGFYKVNADCTVYFAEPKEGICEEDGKLYYYEDGEKVAKGLVYDEKTGNYYCFGIRYYAIGEGEYWFNEAKLNGLAGPNGETLKPGLYKVNADCTVIIK